MTSCRNTTTCNEARRSQEDGSFATPTKQQPPELPENRQECRRGPSDEKCQTRDPSAIVLVRGIEADGQMGDRRVRLGTPAQTLHHARNFGLRYFVRDTAVCLAFRPRNSRSERTSVSWMVRPRYRVSTHSLERDGGGPRLHLLRTSVTRWLRTEPIAHCHAAQSGSTAPEVATRILDGDRGYEGVPRSWPSTRSA